MEKLMRALNAVPQYIEVCVIRDYDKPLFHYEYECRLVDADSGIAIPGGRGLGLCTSYESAFRWRWVQAHEVPEGVDTAKLTKRGGRTSEFAFAVDKAETGGKYGKPAEYWQMFKDAIEAGKAKSTVKTSSGGKTLDAWEIDTTVYRIENPDIFDQVNGIMKRAKKRSLGDAVKGAANVSEHFTVDLEDLPTMHFEQPRETIIITTPETEATPEATKSQSVPSGETLPVQVDHAPASDADAEAVDMPGELFQALMKDKSIADASKASQERAATIRKLWAEGTITAEMDEYDRVLAVIDRLQSHRKAGDA
jgi:hypothetical protein